MYRVLLCVICLFINDSLCQCEEYEKKEAGRLYQEHFQRALKNIKELVLPSVATDFFTQNSFGKFSLESGHLSPKFQLELLDASCNYGSDKSEHVNIKYRISPIKLNFKFSLGLSVISTGRPIEGSVILTLGGQSVTAKLLKVTQGGCQVVDEGVVIGITQNYQASFGFSQWTTNTVSGLLQRVAQSVINTYLVGYLPALSSQINERFSIFFNSPYKKEYAEYHQKMNQIFCKS